MQIVDARNPLRFRCEDLEAYINDIEGPEGEKGSGNRARKSMLLINKADLLTRKQRWLWADYFEKQGVAFAFYSAANAAALQEMPLREEVAKVVPSTSQNETDEGSSSEDQGPSSSSDEASDESGANDIKEEDNEGEDPRTRVLTVKELEELFIQSAPPLTGEYLFGTRA